MLCWHFSSTLKALQQSQHQEVQQYFREFRRCRTSGPCGACRFLEVSSFQWRQLLRFQGFLAQATLLPVLPTSPSSELTQRPPAWRSLIRATLRCWNSKRSSNPFASTARSASSFRHDRNDWKLFSVQAAPNKTFDLDIFCAAFL